MSQTKVTHQLKELSEIQKKVMLMYLKRNPQKKMLS